jgi:hypothetical protein
MTPSPVIATLVRLPLPAAFATNIVRTSEIDVIELAPVMTLATGIEPLAKPVVLDPGAQLFEASRNT